MSNQRANLITFISDFGMTDGYVGTVKGSILCVNPQARIVDISHNIDAWAVQEASWLIFNSYKYFPVGTVHLVVVDPEVGSQQRRILLASDDYYFVGPDSGVFSLLLTEHMAGSGQTSNWRAYHLNNECYWRDHVSTSFHARDILGPVAAHLSLGEQEESLGPRIPMDSLFKFASHAPSQRKGKLEGQVIYIDRFGNLITNIPSHMVSNDCRCSVGSIGVGPVRTTYSCAKSGESLAFIGSHGFLEIAVNQGSARAKFRSSIGDLVCVDQEG